MTASEDLIKQINVAIRSKKNLGTFSTTHMTEEAVNVFNYYASLNAVDSCAYPEFISIEQECGKFFLDLYHGNNHNDYRYFTTSGSSEALFMSLLFMKNYWRSKNPATTTKPNFIIGTNGHTALHKAAAYLDVELRLIPVHKQHLNLDMNQIVSQIDANTIGVACTLGATTTLLFDEIEKLNTLLQQFRLDNNIFIPLHVDAASGGFIAPFSHPELIWDFRLEHVMSINVSSHKFGMVYPSLGWLCVKNEISSEDLAHESHYLGKSIKRYPIQFSHSASHIFTQCYYIKALKKEGYEKIVKQLFEMAAQLVVEFKKFEQIKVITPNKIPALPGIIFTLNKSSPEHNLAALASYLEANGWHLPTFRLPHPCSDELASRIIIRHGFNEQLMQDLLKDMTNYFASTPE